MGTMIVSKKDPIWTIVTKKIGIELKPLTVYTTVPCKHDAG